MSVYDVAMGHAQRVYTRPGSVACPHCGKEWASNFAPWPGIKTVCPQCYAEVRLAKQITTEERAGNDIATTVELVWEATLPVQGCAICVAYQGKCL